MPPGISSVSYTHLYGQEAGEQSGDDQRTGLAYQRFQFAQDSIQHPHSLQKFSEGKTEQSEGDRGHHTGDTAPVEQLGDDFVRKVKFESGGH